jgi:hypothetical protein
MGEGIEGIEVVEVVEVLEVAEEEEVVRVVTGMHEDLEKEANTHHKREEIEEEEEEAVEVEAAVSAKGREVAEEVVHSALELLLEVTGVNGIQLHLEVPQSKVLRLRRIGGKRITLLLRVLLECLMISQLLLWRRFGKGYRRPNIYH